MLNYNSAHPSHQLQGMAYGFISRVLSITSNNYKQDSIKKIQEILRNNGFSNNNIKTLLKKYGSIQNQEMLNNIQIYYKSLTYTPHMAEQLQKLFLTHDENLRIGFKPFTSNNRIINNHKITLPSEEKHGVIYKIPCNGCTGIYIGHTGQKLKERIKQHKQDIKQKHALKNQTAALQHIIKTGHSFDYENTEILDTQINYRKRLTLESIYINIHNSTTVNMRDDMDSLNPTYLSLLDHLK